MDDKRREPERNPFSTPVEGDSKVVGGHILVTSTPSSVFSVLFKLLLCGALIGWLCIKVIVPKYHEAKIRRAEQFVVEAGELLKTKELSAAVFKAQAAYAIVQNASSIRMLAMVLTEMESEQALFLWERLVGSNVLATEDRRSYLGAALKVQRLDIASRLSDELLELKPPLKADVIQAAQIARALKKSDKEYAILSRACIRWPEDFYLRFLRQRTLLAVGDEAQVQASIQEIVGNVHSTSRVGLESLLTVAELPYSVYPNRAELAGLLLNHPLSSDLEMILAYQIQIQVAPREQSEKLTQLLSLTKKRSDSTLLAIAQWLTQNREFERVLDFITPARARSNQMLTLLRLDALSNLGRLADLTTEIAATPLPGEFRAFYLWKTRRVAKIEAGDLEILQAIDSARYNAGKLLFLAPRLESLDRVDLAMSVFERLKAQAGFEIYALGNLVRISRQQCNTPQLLRFLEQKREVEPPDPRTESDLLHVRLLLDKEVKGDALEKLVKDWPGEVPFKATYALWLLKHHESPEALQVFTDCKFNWKLAGDSARTVYALALQANGNFSEAAPVLAHLRRANLLPEEKRLLLLD